jgi:DNA (cytosine-5)-methyltransferase 1
MQFAMDLPEHQHSTPPTRVPARPKRLPRRAPAAPSAQIPLQFPSPGTPPDKVLGELRPPLRVAGLFAGIGGIEVGLAASEHRTVMLCEIDDNACRVLDAHRHGETWHLARDVREVSALPEVDLLVAGFPCQDLSQAGRTAGIGGQRSGLVAHVFRLLESAAPQWLLLENVPFMLSLDQGEAMRFLTHALNMLGFNWAYRVVDTRSFGLPQRRQRVLLLASRTEDPRTVLLSDDAGEPMPRTAPTAFGFYWTEGRGGLGWAADAVPTLKGGSTIGIPSAPAVWIPATGEVFTPTIEDAERLQGFAAGWTAAAVTDPARKNNSRWKLVGNAVSVPVAAWLGRRLREPLPYDGANDPPLSSRERWPTAAWSMRDGTVHKAARSMWPVATPTPTLLDFLGDSPRKPLSARATAGFLQRAEKGSLRFMPGFLDAIRRHLELQRQAERVGTVPPRKRGSR